MFKRLIGAIAALTMLVGVSACGGQRNSEPEYADEEAMSVIAEGLQKRFDVLDQQEKKQRGRQRQKPQEGGIGRNR